MSTHTQISLSPGKAVYFSPPFTANGGFVSPTSVNLTYDFGSIQSWGTVEITIWVLDSNEMVYESGYHKLIEGYTLIDNMSIQTINIFFEASPNNPENITVQWLSPMTMHFIE